jgi:hypothetical protein
MKNTQLIHRAYDQGVRTVADLAQYMKGKR